MELYIYDRNMILQGVIDEISSLIWTRRYWAAGEFKLLVPFTERHVALLIKNRLILKRGDTEAAEIRFVNIFDGNGRGDPQGAPEVKEQRPPQGEEIVRADGGREDRAGHREAIIPELAWPRGEGELLSLDPQHGSAFQQILQQGRRRAERA